MKILCYVTVIFNKELVNLWFGWGRFGFLLLGIKICYIDCCFAAAIVKNLNEKLNVLIQIIIGLTG
jgi:hypothetical protein